MTNPLFSNGTTANAQSQTTVIQPTPQAIVTASPFEQPASTANIVPVTPSTALVPIKPLQLDSFITSLGSSSAQSISKIGTEVLAHAKSSDLGAFGDQLTDLILKTKNLNPETLSKNRGFFGKLMGAVSNAREHLVAEFNTVEKQIDNLGIQLAGHRRKHQDSIAAMDRLYDQNKLDHDNMLKELDAARVVLAQERAKLDALDVSQYGIMDQQIVSDNRNELNRLEQRINELAASVIVAEQTAPEIRGLQANAKMLIDKFTIIQEIGIPIWKKQFSLALLNSDQEKSIAVVNSVTDAMNQMMIANAQKLKQNTLAITNATSQTMIKAETVEQVNDCFIEMMQEAATALSENKVKAKESETRMIASNAKLLSEMKKHNHG